MIFNIFRRKLAPPPAAPEPVKPRRGRPRIGNEDETIEAQQPWLAMNMSRSTWYRRQAENRGNDKTA